MSTVSNCRVILLVSMDYSRGKSCYYFIGLMWDCYNMLHIITCACSSTSVSFSIFHYTIFYNCYFCCHLFRHMGLHAENRFLINFVFIAFNYFGGHAPLFKYRCINFSAPQGRDIQLLKVVALLGVLCEN